MSNTEPRPKVPRTMDYTDDERALAREIQGRAPSTQEEERKKGLGLKGKVGLVLAGLGIAGTAGLVGKSMGGGEPAPAPEKSPATSAPVTPGETPAASESPTTAETETPEAPVEYGISTELESNPEAIAEAYYGQYNAFLIDVATREAYDSTDYLAMDLTDFVETKSVETNQKFVDELFIENWDQNPALAEYVSRTLQIAQRTRELRLLSYNGVDNADLEPYYREKVIQSTETTGAPIITTSVSWTERDNGPKTSVMDNLNGPDVNSLAGGDTFIWVNEDGKLKISDISLYAG